MRFLRSKLSFIAFVFAFLFSLALSFQVATASGLTQSTSICACCSDFEEPCLHCEEMGHKHGATPVLQNPQFSIDPCQDSSQAVLWTGFQTLSFLHSFQYSLFSFWEKDLEYSIQLPSQILAILPIETPPPRV